MRHNLSLTNQLSHWIPGEVKVVFFFSSDHPKNCITLQKSFRSLSVPKIAFSVVKPLSWVVEHVEKRRGWGETGKVAA